MPRTDTTLHKTETPREREAPTVPRDEILAVAARAFRENHDAFEGLGYRYVVLRGERLVGAGTSAEDAWAQAKARGTDPDEAFCASVIHGCVVHPY